MRHTVSLLNNSLLPLLQKITRGFKVVCYVTVPCWTRLNTCVWKRITWMFDETRLGQECFGSGSTPPVTDVCWIWAIRAAKDPSSTFVSNLICLFVIKSWDRAPSGGAVTQVTSPLALLTLTMMFFCCRLSVVSFARRDISVSKVGPGSKWFVFGVTG